MSSIANAVRVAANAAANKAKNSALQDESELAYLDEKPSIGRRAGLKKGKRNSFIKYMQKRDGTNQLVEKILVNDAKLSKKRRAKLVTNLNDDLALQVPYSLNRKNRWEGVESAADLVKGADESDEVTVSGLDCRVPLSYWSSSDVCGYHEMTHSGLKSKVCANAMNGTDVDSLKNSMNSPKDVKKSKKRSKRLAYSKIVQDNDEDALDTSDDRPHIRYAISKPHSVPMLYAGWMYSHSTSGSRCRDNRNYKNEVYLEELEHSMIDEEPEIDMTASIAALYRAPRQSSFSLGDFIKDSSPAVLINCKSIESLDDPVAASKNKPLEEIKELTPTCSGIPHVQVDEHKLCKDTLFMEVNVEKAKICGQKSLVETFEPLEKEPEYRFRWLNGDKTRCVIDLTKKLDEHTTKIALVVVIEELRSKEGFLRVLLNGSFGCPEGVVIDFLKEKSYNSVNQFVETFVTKLQKYYNKSQESKKQLNSLAVLNSIFHGHQLTKAVDPCGDYKIIEDSVARNPTVEAIMIDVEEDEDEDDMDFDEFELIEMDEVISDEDDSVTGAEDTVDDEIEVLPDFGSGCDFCDIEDVDELLMLDGCGHRFCRRCLKNELSDAIVRQTAYPLTCLHENCQSQISMEFLLTIIPLPLAEYYFRFAFMAENVANGKTVIECPHCQDLASVDQKPAFGSIKCNKCSISFCSRCQRQPHYPLTCQQMSVWEDKFNKQFTVDMCRQSANGSKKCSCGEWLQNDKKVAQVSCGGCNIAYIWKTGEPTGRNASKAVNLETVDAELMPNNIAGEFSQICSQARVTRFNLVSNRQITKKMCKSVDFRMKQGFIEIRKTALHLIEFGFAWLYINRNDRPANYSAVKTSLTTLRNKLEAIHSEIERAQTDGIEPKIAELNGLVQKILDEFSH